jgi:hypothetical protein
MMKDLVASREIQSKKCINIFEYRTKYHYRTLEPTQSYLAPCGILCGACPLGSGALAESAGRTRKHITDCQIPMWSPFVPGGEAIVLGRLWTPALEWMTTYARCAGCQSGGGPPGLHPQPTFCLTVPSMARSRAAG